MYGNEDTRLGHGIDLNRVLTELHGKRKWLDELIGGLEAVARSPEVALVTAVEDVLSGDWRPKPKVDLGSRKKARLLRLASRVKIRTVDDRASQPTQQNVSA